MSNQSAPDALTKAGEDAADELRNTHGYNGDVEETVAVVLNCVRTALAQTAPQAQSGEAPIDMILHCPKCGLQHVDADESRELSIDGTAWLTTRLGWDNPPHRSHLCHGCGCIWRPADVPTNGVAAIKTRGKADSAPAERTEPPDTWPPTVLEALRFYAGRDHFTFDDNAWDTVSGEPQNFWCDEAGTATVEDGTVAAAALAALAAERTEPKAEPLARLRITAVPGGRNVEFVHNSWFGLEAGEYDLIAAAPTDGADR